MIAFKSLTVLSYSLQNGRFLLQFKLCKLVAESFQIDHFVNVTTNFGLYLWDSYSNANKWMPVSSLTKIKVPETQGELPMGQLKLHHNWILTV